MGFAQRYRSEGEKLGIKKGILIGEEKGIEKVSPKAKARFFAAYSPAALKAHVDFGRGNS